MAECEVADCGGTAVDGARCIAHVPSDRLSYLIGVYSGAPPVGGHGCVIDADRVLEIVALLTDQRGTMRRGIDLRKARIQGDLALTRLDLHGPILLSGATAGRLELRELRGLGHLDFGEERTRVEELVVECRGDDERLEIQQVDVSRELRVEYSQFRALGLHACSIGDQLRLKDVVSEVVEARECRFPRLQATDLRVRGRVTIRDCLARWLTLANFELDGFLDTSSPAAADLYRGAIGGPARIVWIPPASAREALTKAWGGAEVPGIELRDETDTPLRLNLVRFGSTARLRWCGGDVELRDTDFTDASSLAGAAGASRQPGVKSVKGLDGEELSLRGPRIAKCMLSEASGLGPIEPAALWSGHGNAGWAWRRYIADEVTLPGRPGNTERAHRLAATYRDLRLSLEAIGDHSGANDLHYGERLWQRKAAMPLTPTWWWLALYGLLGYGVRPWRPLFGLVVLVLVGGALLGSADLRRERVLSGSDTASQKSICDQGVEARTPAERRTVTCPVDGWDAVAFSARSTTGLVRPPTGYEARGAAEWIELATRLLAALLFALFVLAVRNRVRR